MSSRVNHHGSDCSSDLSKLCLHGFIPASAMYEIGNASKKGSAGALSLGYLVAALILLHYLARFLRLNNALASRSTCISISFYSKSVS